MSDVSVQGASLPMTRRTNQASSILKSEYLSASTPGRIVSPTSSVVAYPYFLATRWPMRRFRRASPAGSFGNFLPVYPELSARARGGSAYLISADEYRRCEGLSVNGTCRAFARRAVRQSIKLGGVR